MWQFVYTKTHSEQLYKVEYPHLSEEDSPQARTINGEQHQKRTATCGSKSVRPVSRPVGKGQLSCSRQIVWTADYEHLSTGHTKVSNPGNTVNIHPVGSHSALHSPHPSTHCNKSSILTFICCWVAKLKYLNNMLIGRTFFFFYTNQVWILSEAESETWEKVCREIYQRMRGWGHPRHCYSYCSTIAKWQIQQRFFTTLHATKECSLKDVVMTNALFHSFSNIPTGIQDGLFVSMKA